ncbi:MAG: FAD-dependent oxidoreductase [Clostridia bacterium]|nr:FAD-dependent oxidoreductase [Clostridia bacterium]
MYDCIIIGSGIAGISAALTLQANGKNFALLGSKDLSVKIEKAAKVDNYPGLYNVTGKAFVASLKEQLTYQKIDVQDERVTGVYAMNGCFTLLTESGKSMETKTVILAVGVETAGKITGEEEFTGRGVSYCATCDGALYKGKTIAVVCTSKRFEGEVEFLSSIAKTLYYIPLYKNPEIQGENVQIKMEMPTQIQGGMKVEKLLFKSGELAVDGVFMLKESTPPNTLVGGLETENGHVKTQRNTATNLAGLFAAGDCTGRPYQYAKAAGEGNVAAHAVLEYLREEK